MKTEKTIKFYELDNGKRYAIKAEDDTNKAMLIALPPKVNGKLVKSKSGSSEKVLATVNMDKVLEFLRYMKKEEDTGITVEEQLKRINARFK